MTRSRWWCGALVLTLVACGGPDYLYDEQPAPTRTPSPNPTTGPAVDESVLMPRGGVFGERSIWRRDVASVPVAAGSPMMVDSLLEALEGTGGETAFNLYHYGVSWWTVDRDQSATTVRFDNCQGKPEVPLGLYGEGGQFVNVPIPDDAVPTVGTDSSLAIYRPATDQLWDLWKVRRGKRGWHACWGGRIDDVSQDDGVFTFPFGTAASGLAYEGGTLSVNDVRSGVIEHAVALQLPPQALRNDFVPPATRTDGEIDDPDAIPEGSRLRLSPDVDVAALDLTPVGEMVARAAQTYGFIVTDRAGNVAITAEAPTAIEGRTGVDPWRSLIGDVPPYLVMQNFPWDEVVVLEPDRSTSDGPTNP